MKWAKQRQTVFFFHSTTHVIVFTTIFLNHWCLYIIFIILLFHFILFSLLFHAHSVELKVIYMNLWHNVLTWSLRSSFRVAAVVLIHTCRALNRSASFFRALFSIATSLKAPWWQGEYWLVKGGIYMHLSKGAIDAACPKVHTSLERLLTPTPRRMEVRRAGQQ